MEGGGSDTTPPLPLRPVRRAPSINSLQSMENAGKKISAYIDNMALYREPMRGPGSVQSRVYNVV